MNQSGEAAEQVIRLVVNGAEEAVKISGQAAYHLIALLTANLKSDKKGRRKLSAGRTRLLNLLRDGSQLKIFSMRPNDIRAFQRKAKKYKVQYAIVKNKRSGHADVVARVADVDLINRVMLGMGYGQEASLTREPDARAEAVRADDLKKKDLPQRDASGRPDISSTRQPEATPTSTDLPGIRRNRMPRSPREAPDTPAPSHTPRPLSLHGEPDVFIPPPPPPPPKTEKPAVPPLPPRRTDREALPPPPSTSPPNRATGRTAPPSHKPSVKEKMADCQRRAKISAQGKTHQRSRKKIKKRSR